MKKITFFIVVSALMASCSEKELIEQKIEPLLKVTISDSTNLELQAVNAEPYNLLGHGYDATGFYFNALSGRAKVLDIEKLIELHPGHYVYGNPSAHYSNTLAGYSASMMVQMLSGRTESYFHPTTDSSKWNMFCGQLSAVFDPSTLSSDKNTYGLYEEFILMRSYTFYETMDTLRNHLTESFQTDLQKETPENILKKYGTHVLTNVHLGGKIVVIYKSRIPSTDASWRMQVGLSQSVLYLFGHSMSIASTNEPFVNEEQEVFAATSGGIRMTPWQGTVSTDTLTRSIVNLTPWFESLKENPSLIDVDEDHLIPIYELVGDETKRAALRSAYNRYFLKSKADLLGQ